MYNLQSAHKIIFNNRPPLSFYMHDFINILDETVLSIETTEENFDLLFLKRHIPHLMGLHYFQDKKSKNKLLTMEFQLKNIKGFINMANGLIKWSDLELSRGGTVWKKYKLRALSIHLLKEILFNSDIYKFDGKIKNSVKGKYLMVSSINNTTFNIVVDEDIEYNRLDKYYCCISNLINDNEAKRIIQSGKVTKLEKKRFIHKNLMDQFTREVKVYKYPIHQNNRNVITKQVKYACIKELIEKDCCFYSIYVSTTGMYSVSYLYFDKITTRIIEKYI